MPRHSSTSGLYLAKQIAFYICAVLLPIAASLLTTHTHALSTIPFALSFSVIAGIGALAGPGPAIVSIVVSLLFFNFHISPPHPIRGFSVGQIERSAVLIAATFFVTFISWKQRSAENKLRSTLESLQERTDALLQAQQSSDLATWLLDTSTMQMFWDLGSTRIFGRPFADLDNQAFPMEFIHPEDRDCLREAVTTSVRTSEQLFVEYRVLWPDGEVRWIESRGTRLTGDSSYWRGAALDITRRKIVEAALVRSEKLAAMGRLASTVAHEVNNPLESVTNLLYLIGTDDNLNPDTRSYVTLAEEEIARLANITRLTLTFARSASIRAPINVSDVLDAVLSLYQRRCDMLHVIIERFYTPGLMVEMPPHELRQIAINLVANAIDALSSQQPLIRLHTLSRDDRAILLIEDSGTGIANVDQARVFDAFFTTKSDVGTGIGLWVTRELVEKNGGSITVESGELGAGVRTRFRLEFPIAPASEALASS
ncbi:MAG: ATP-binding protein [Edaphobacter sp.]|uniref:sensor histidine kinase n=1 Tax=Edaphobacter sp. TaxID=1934404 RepID=UPI002399CCE4|nr:ATP-binding protein [Edaphobacter sp.]MDE1176476.1 ATP-binding protein [Edaphobacter sp.]